jgi:protein-serine/threonine kinase
MEPNTQFILRRPLGQGTFSSVWLAEDFSEPPLSLALARKRNREKRGNKSIPGTKPMTSFNKENTVGNGDTYFGGTQANGASQQNGNVWENGVMEQNRNSGRLVAVKMTLRAVGDDPDCTRVSFIREVEVLRVRILFPHPPFAFLYHLTI